MSTTITIETSVSNPRPTDVGVRDGVDYDAELWVTDETGERFGWRGELTYAPAQHDHDQLVPYGGGIDHWMSSDLISAIRTPWIAAHQSLVDAIVQSLGSGEGNETIEVRL